MPFYRIDSVNCKLYHQLPSNASLADKSAREVACSACKRLVRDLEWQLKRTASESPSRKIKRQSSTSRARIPCEPAKEKAECCNGTGPG